jgi:hypothetical protein
MKKLPRNKNESTARHKMRNQQAGTCRNTRLQKREKYQNTGIRNCISKKQVDSLEREFTYRNQRKKQPKAVYQKTKTKTTTGKHQIPGTVRQTKQHAEE